jgi:hypothetical protein
MRRGATRGAARSPIPWPGRAVSDKLLACPRAIGAPPRTLCTPRFPTGAPARAQIPILSDILNIGGGGGEAAGGGGSRAPAPGAISIGDLLPINIPFLSNPSNPPASQQQPNPPPANPPPANPPPLSPPPSSPPPSEPVRRAAPA